MYRLDWGQSLFTTRLPGPYGTTGPLFPTGSQAYSQDSFYPVSRENGSGQAASGRFIFGPDLPVTAFSARTAYSENRIAQISCPVHVSDPPLLHTPMMIPVPGCISAVVHIAAQLYHMAKTLDGLWIF